MFERFTDRARRVIVLSQEEAKLLDHNYIGTEHVLLGLIREGEGVAAVALASLGITYDAAAAAVIERIGRGSTHAIGYIPLTPRAKQAMEGALRVSLELGNPYIATEHLLLALYRDDASVAVHLLTTLGVTSLQVRNAVLKELGHADVGKPLVEPVSDFAETKTQEGLEDVSIKGIRHQDGSASIEISSKDIVDVLEFTLTLRDAKGNVYRVTQEWPLSETPEKGN